MLTAHRQDVDVDLKIDTFAMANGHPISRERSTERYSRPLEDAPVFWKAVSN